MYVLDTNILIYFFKGAGRVSERLLEVAPKEIGIPAVVLYELEYGIARSTHPKKRQQQLGELCSLVQVLPFGSLEAKLAAAVRVKLERRGTPIGPHDLLVAATALSNNAVLVTNNTKEFSRISKLQLRNWYA